MSYVPVQAIAGIGGAEAVAREVALTTTTLPGGFGKLLLDGVAKVNQQVVQADAMVAAFAIDGTIPPHQVTLALEQARMSLELMMQVRTHLVDGYHEILRMQL